MLKDRLFALDSSFRPKRTVANKPLRVFYGWSRVNKIRKKEAISVLYENDRGRDERTMRFVHKMMDVVHVRNQTDGEKRGAAGAIRMFTEYSIFLSEKRYQGSLTLAIKANSEADRNNVSEAERRDIATKLRQSYLESHPDYREPIIQCTLEI